MSRLAHNLIKSELPKTKLNFESGFPPYIDEKRVKLVPWRHFTIALNFRKWGKNENLPAWKRRDSVLAIISDGVSYFDAGAIPTGCREALHFLKEGAVNPGDRVRVNGAGGSIGSFGVQLPKLSDADIYGEGGGRTLTRCRT